MRVRVLAIEVVLIDEVGWTFLRSKGTTQVLVKVQEVFTPHLHIGPAVLPSVPRVYGRDFGLLLQLTPYIRIVPVVTAVDDVGKVPRKTDRERDDLGLLSWWGIVTLKTHVGLLIERLRTFSSLSGSLVPGR